MNKGTQLFSLLLQLSGSRFAIAVVSALLPLLIMVVFAIFMAFKFDYIVLMSVTIALSTLLVIIPLFVIGRIRNKSTLENDAKPVDSFVKASQQWSQTEVLMWQKAKRKSQSLLAKQNQWRDIEPLSIEMFTFVATQFDKKALDFSIPEGLQLLEEISRRYKNVIQEFIPGISLVKVSHVTQAYSAYEQYGTIGAKAVKVAIWANYAKNLYFNPAKLTADFIKDKSSASMTKGLADNIQVHAKQALLDEVVSVAIDLYSGRFSFEDSEVLASSIASDDINCMASPLEPLRIVFVGQTGAGKSSIINMLKAQVVSEVDALPSTSAKTVYATSLADTPVVVVDQKGLDGTASSLAAMLNEMTQADLIVWVVKANQSARALDTQLKNEFDAFYAQPQHISYRKPFTLGLINQVDNLKPIQQWQPPYNIDKPVCTKSTVIKQAVDYNQQLLQFDLALALSIAPNKTAFGIPAVSAAIVEVISNARNTQINRQRLQHIKSNTSVKSQVKRVFKSTKALYPAIVKNAVPTLKHMVIKKITR